MLVRGVSQYNEISARPRPFCNRILHCKMVFCCVTDPGRAGVGAWIIRYYNKYYCKTSISRTLINFAQVSFAINFTQIFKKIAKKLMHFWTNLRKK